VTEAAALTERYDPAAHEVADFACGEESLDRWLHRYAGQGERRDATRTFVATDEQGTVRGYYTLVAGQLEHVEATEAVRKGLSRHFPIPVAILARLAVDERSQGQGLGASLLNDALKRICRAAQRSLCGRWSFMPSTKQLGTSTSASASAVSVRRRGA
jgi:GNAT superfamily N-acetyltransferase